MGAVGAGDAAKPATQEALDWGTCLDVGAVTRVLRYREKEYVDRPRFYSTGVQPLSYIYKSNGGRTTGTRHAGKQEVTPPKRGSSLPNYLDQTQSREFG